MTTVPSTTASRSTRPEAPWQLPTKLHELADAGPVASIYLDTSGDLARGTNRVRPGWADLRRRLHRNGAPEPLLAALDECTDRAHVLGGGLAAFVTAEGLGHVEHLENPPGIEGAWWGALPHSRPLLTARQREVPMVVVATDRVGAEFLLAAPGVADLSCRVVGEDLLITRSAPGGWSRRRSRQRADQRWVSSARAVGESLTWLVDLSGARLVVASGGVRAMQFLRSHLPPRIAELVVEVQDDDGSAGHLAARARALAADVAAEEEQRVVAELLAGLPTARACVGAGPTLRAVAAGQAEEVLIATDPVDRRGQPLSAVTRVADRRDWMTAGPVAGYRAPLPDVLVHAAGATSAVVRTIRDGRRIDDGVGALLRHQQPTDRGTTNSGPTDTGLVPTAEPEIP